MKFYNDGNQVYVRIGFLGRGWLTVSQFYRSYNDDRPWYHFSIFYVTNGEGKNGTNLVWSWTPWRFQYNH